MVDPPAPEPDSGTGSEEDGGSGELACAEGDPLPIPASASLQEVSSGGQLVLFFDDFAARYAARGQPQSFAANGAHYFFSTDGTRAYSGRPFWGFGGGEGEVYGLDARTGEQTTIFGADAPEVTADLQTRSIVARSTEGRLWLYDADAERRHELSSTASSLGFPVGRDWAFDSLGVLKVWVRAAGAVVSLSEWTRATPVEGGLLFVDPKGDLFGWSASGGIQPLGRADAEPVIAGHRDTSAKGLVLIDAEGTAWAWTYATGQVRRLATAATSVAISEDGARAAVASGSGSSSRLELVALATGARRTVLSPAPEAVLAFDAGSDRLAAAVRQGGLWEVTLIDVATGTVTPAEDTPPQLENERIALDFSPGGGALLVTPAAEAQSVYDSGSGALRYRTRLGVDTSGTFGRWISEEALLLRHGAHMGPPDRALYAFETGGDVERKLADQTRVACGGGTGVFFEAGVVQLSEEPGALMHWRPGADPVQVAEKVRAVRCTRDGDLALFLDDPAPVESGPPGPGTLRWSSAADLPGGSYAEEVSSYVLGTDSVAFLTPAAACVAALPAR